jgi:hypothetical protein
MGFARELSLSPSAVAALLGRFRSTGFFALDSAYVPDHPLCQVYATDQPGAYLFANDGTNRHAVTHYFGWRGPRGTSTDSLLAVPYRLLFALEGSIDSLAGTAAYVDSLTGSRGG